MVDGRRHPPRKDDGTGAETGSLQIVAKSRDKRATCTRVPETANIPSPSTLRFTEAQKAPAAEFVIT